MIALWLARLVEVYAAVGIVFAVPFVVSRAGMIDPAARDAGLWFRLIILPGAALLWPVLVIRRVHK